MYLQNEDVFKKIALYIKGDGVLKEISRDDIPKDSIARPGSYVKVNGKYFGAYGTPKGPVIFLEQKEFLLTDEKLIFEHARGEKQHHFKAYYDSDLVCDIEYDHWAGIDADNWSDEKSKDFFIWLTSAQTNKEFISMWTKKIKGINKGHPHNLTLPESASFKVIVHHSFQYRPHWVF